MLTTEEYLEKAGPILLEAKIIAAKYRSIIERPLGIAGEVAEYEAVRLLKLEICEVRKEGYDAIRKFPREEKIQIKGRIILPDSKRGQKLGSIRMDKEWDAVVLVIMNESFEPQIMYELKRNHIQNLFDSSTSKASKRGQMSVSKFKSLAGEPVWRKAEENKAHS